MKIIFITDKGEQTHDQANAVRCVVTLKGDARIIDIALGKTKDLMKIVC